MRRTIRGKMILFIGLPAAAVFVTALLWILSFAEKQARRIREAEMAEQAASYAARFDEYFGKAARVADTTARFIQIVPDLRENQILGLLGGTVKINRRIYGAAMAFEPGSFKDDDSLFCPYVYEKRDGSGLVKINIDEYDWYGDEQWQWWHLPKKLQKGVWTDPYFDEGAGNILMTTYAVPFKRHGEFSGVTTVDIDLERLREDSGEAISGLGSFYIIGPKGRVISSPDPSEILGDTLFERLEKKGRSDLIEVMQKILSGPSGEQTLDGMFDGERVIMAHAPIPSPGWTFLSVIPEHEALADFHQHRAYAITGFMGAGVLMLLTIVFMSGKVSGPIRKLRGQVLRVADGESDIEIADTGTGDEISELAKAFANMQEKVSDREAKLENARETTLTELLESAPDAMIVADAGGRICRMNTKMAEIFGYNREELEAMTVEDLMPKQFRQGHGQHMNDYFADPKAREMGAALELLGRRKDGSEFPIELGLSPFHEPSGVMAVAAIRDITQRKKAEAEIKLARNDAEAANHAKSDFLSSMSHELRTPLNGVLGYAQILQRDKSATPRQRDNVESIISCGDHLLSLINDVLDLSKIEAGRLELDEGPCDLSKLVRSITDIISQRAQSKQLDFAVDVSAEVPRGIVTDSAKLRQVLVNLLGNAVKFTAEGSVTLRIRETDDHRLALEVIDTGIGLDEHEVEEVFDPFKQVEAGKAAGGTGLGLAISRKLLEKMGGDIEVDSEKGKGSCFRVILPLVEAEEDELDAMDFNAGSGPGSAAAATLAAGQTVRILVTDDREANRDILEQLLDEAGFEVTLADDGDTALEAMRGAENSFDLVLMDVRMPRLNGIDAVKQIREDDDLKSIPVIAVTASVFPEFREKAKAAGFDDFLPKPFRAAELMDKLKEQLNLEWEMPAAEDYADGQAPAPGDSSSASESTTAPADAAASPTLPDEALEKFRAALKIKNLTALKTLAIELAKDPQTAATGDEIGRLAQGFDFAGLARLEQELST